MWVEELVDQRPDVSFPRFDGALGEEAAQDLALAGVVRRVRGGEHHWNVEALHQLAARDHSS